MLAACGDGAAGRNTSAGSASTVTFTGGIETGTTDGAETEGETGADATEGPTTASTSSATESDSDTEASSGPSTESSSDGDTGGVCRQGEHVCNGNHHAECDGQGGFVDEQDCGANVCVPDLGCVECVPGDHQCVGDTSHVCNDQGQWEPKEVCDTVQGVSCDAGLGECVGACSEAALGLTYIGCDYYPVVVEQLDAFATPPANVYAVAVANTSGQMATVTVTQGANQIVQTQVAAGGVAVMELPWVTQLVQGTGPSKVVVDGAYRLRSTQPVTVYQYNPLNGNVSNDASLLLPVNAWGSQYVVAAWNHWPSYNYPGIYAVTASQDGTIVDLTPSATGGQVQAGGGVAANGTGQIHLDAGDVLQVYSTAGDLTGTRVEANHPVQVIGGHSCSNVPLNITACDHLEESMFPVDALATEYVVVPPVQYPNTSATKAHIVRIIATEPNTNLTTEPNQGLPGNLANAGDYVQTPMTTAAFTVSADKKILVAQYMVGQSAGYGTSDPAMVLAVPTEQFRNEYLFHAAPTWVANFVDIVAPTGASVIVDGAAVTNWAAIGATGLSVAHVPLSNAGNGNHILTTDNAVGISVYGVRDYGSYWYPGGLDLTIIPQ